MTADKNQTLRVVEATTRKQADKIASELRYRGASSVQITGKRGSWKVTAEIDPIEFAKVCETIGAK